MVTWQLSSRVEHQKLLLRELVLPTVLGDCVNLTCKLRMNLLVTVPHSWRA